MKIFEFTQSLSFQLAIRFPLLLLLIFASDLSNAQFGPQNVIAKINGARSVYASDLDGDGDMDVLSAAHYNAPGIILWYENMGNGSFSSLNIISTEVDGAMDVFASDLDGDGDMDVLSASDVGDKIAWYENLGSGVFGNQNIIHASGVFGATSVYASDLDGDGDMDVLSGSWVQGKVAWYENLGGGNFATESIITIQSEYGAGSVYASDLDGDGDMDVLSTFVGSDKVAWYENTGGGVFTSQSIISTAAEGVVSVYAEDLDGDGDMDVLSASYFDDKIAWYENLGSGVFASQSIISTQTDEARDIYASDLDGDGDMDVLSASRSDDKIAWYENLGGGVFGSQNIISAQTNGAWSVYTSDLDGDGDLDVLSASRFDGKIAWYKNQTITDIVEQKENANHFFIYPNPGRGVVNLAFQNAVPGLYLVRLVDVFGRTINRTTHKIGSEGKLTFDWSQLVGGSYFLHLLHIKQGIAYSEKVVIQR